MFGYFYRLDKIMYRDFDDFDDEYEYHRLKHQDSISYEAYEWDDLHAIEPVYETDSFSLEFAKELFLALGDITKRFTGFNEGDDPTELYQPNNQTILDPSTMPDTPVNPQVFLDRVTSELLSRGVVISTDMPGLLKYMCRLFNFSIKPNATIPRSIKSLVFPAQTGTGKSVALQVYTSMLEGYSSVIIVSKVEEAISYCEYINKLSGDKDYARCYFAVTDKNKANSMRVEVQALKDYRCIVITHNMFKRVNNNDNQEAFSQYDNESRQFVAIDEKLSFYEQHKVSYKQLDQLVINVEEALDQSETLKRVSTSHDALGLLKVFKAYLVNKDDRIITDSKSIVIKEYLGIDLKSELETIGEALVFSEHSTGFPKKVVGLKNKEAVMHKLKSLGITTQTRKRMVMGVSFMDTVREFSGQLKQVDEFYCKQLDPNLGNCRQKQPGLVEVTEDESQEFSMVGLDSMERLMQHAEQDEKDGIFDEEPVKLAINIIQVLLNFRTHELFQSIENLGAYKNPNYKERTIRAITELTEALRYFSDNHFLIYKTNYETALLATTSLTNKLGLSVVLDATAQFNEYYQLANRFLGHVGLVKAQQIRQYQNLTICKAKGFNQSRSALYRGKEATEIKEIARSYASYAVNELQADDKMLIVCHKDFTGVLRQQVDDSRVQFTHWGNHVGRNNWSDCNKVMLVGWNYLNPIEYVSTISSSLESVLLTSRHLDEALIEKFAISQLADDIVQALMRSQARVIATEDSDCKETRFYLFYKDDDKSTEVLDIVESQFPKALLVDWIPKGDSLTKKPGKRGKNAQRVIEFLVLKSKDHDSYLRTSVQTKLNINKSTMSRIIQDEAFKQMLIEQGFLFRNLDGKSQQFILK